MRRRKTINTPNDHDVDVEDLMYSYHTFLGTCVNRITGQKQLMIGIVTPGDEKPYAYAFKCTGDALSFIEDMKSIINKIDKEEAESNASRD